MSSLDSTDFKINGEAVAKSPTTITIKVKALSDKSNYKIKISIVDSRGGFRA